MSEAPCECKLEGWCERYRRHMTGRAHANCRTRPEFRAKWAAEREGRKPPGVLRMAVRFGGALTRWIAAGRPVVDGAALDRRRSLCAACDHVRPDGGCRLCGCSSVKLTWATEACPDSPPRWREEI